MNAMTQTNPFLQVRDLTLTFGGVRAIAGLNLDVHAGEVLAIIGPNGAGKTSTLNAITRVFDVSSGEILFKGQDLAKVPRHRIARHGIARTFQNIELFDAATVMDNCCSVVTASRMANGGSRSCARLLSRSWKSRRGRKPSR